MTITYLDGRTVPAVLLTRTGDAIRVAIEGADDATEFRRMNGVWVSDDCEPARIEFAWERIAPEAPISEADCCCSQELADRLIHLLFSDSQDEDDEVPASPSAADATATSKIPVRSRAATN